MTLNEAAAILGVHPDTLRRQVVRAYVHMDDAAFYPIMDAIESHEAFRFTADVK